MSRDKCLIAVKFIHTISYENLQNRFAELESEITDRKNFIEEMKSCGKMNEIPPINIQIALLRNEMKEIDSKMSSLENKD